MILGVDNSKYIDGIVIDSPVLGPIPPERLSGGLKTLIMIYEKPEMTFEEYMPFEIFVENENRIITDPEDYIVTAMKYI